MNQQHPTLTTRQGHPVHNNQELFSSRERGPVPLENCKVIEKINHFDRERIPTRVLHARGTGPHGYFEAYGKIGSEPWRSYDFLTPSLEKARSHTNQQGGQITYYVARPAATSMKGRATIPSLEGPLLSLRMSPCRRCEACRRSRQGEQKEQYAQ